MSPRMLVIAAAGLSALLALTGVPAASSSGSTLELRFDWPSSGAVTTQRPPAAGGSAARSVTLSVLTADGGSIQSVKSRSGHGRALGLPTTGNAILAVTPRAGALTPSGADFRFGADVNPTGDWTAGANVVQRGFADDRGQYKLEVDGGRASCSIKGTSGRVTVYGSRPLTAGDWYRLECSRTSAAVTLRIVRLASGQTWTSQKAGKTGAVETASPSTALAIGGKVTPGGRIASWQPDQFRGAIDNVSVQIG